MRKTHERNAKGPFLLTAAEDRALKMARACMTHREIAENKGATHEAKRMVVSSTA